MKIEGLTAAKGEKIQGLVKIDGTEVVVPVTIINGSNEGKNVLVTAGIHGGEYPGIVAAMRVANELNPEDLNGSVVIMHPVNTPSFEARTSEVIPQDGKNLNSIFPGDKEGTIGDRLAHFVECVRKGKDFHLDMHSGDLHEHAMAFAFYPGTCDEQTTKISMEVGYALNMKYMVRSTSKKGAYSSGAHQGVPALLLEKGGCGLWSEKEATNYKEDILAMLNYFDIYEAAEVEGRDVPEVITEATYLTTSNAGCWFPNIEAGDMIKEGEYLGYITDYFGNKLEEHYAKYDGVVLYMTRSLAVPTNNPLIAYGKLNKV